jgi:hypothetical protein
VRTVPAVLDLYRTYRGRGLVVIGVHSPEFARERDLARVREAVDRLGIAYPVAIDNDYAIWRAFGNRYWPTLYLVGADGSIVTRHVGELHVGSSAWNDLTTAIDAELEASSRSHH